MVGRPDRVEFRPAMGFVSLSLLSPLLLLVLGAWGVLRAGEVRAIPIILLVIGLGLGVVGSLDVPHRIVVDERGVHRICLLRRQTFLWDDIMAFRRPPPGWRRRRGRGGRRSGADGLPMGERAIDGSADPVTGKGGLLVETRARRRYLLSAGRERPDTYAAIQELVSQRAPGMSMPGPPYYAQAETPLS